MGVDVPSRVFLKRSEVNNVKLKVTEGVKPSPADLV